MRGKLSSAPVMDGHGKAETDRAGDRISRRRLLGWPFAKGAPSYTNGQARIFSFKCEQPRQGIGLP